MRIYRLLSRHGKMKKRLYPWFDAPAAGAPMRYDGWVWNPKEREWDKSQVDEITIEVRVPKNPMPIEPPRPAQPLYVEGWYWNGRAGVWEEHTMPYHEVLVIPERPPEPTEVPSRTQPAEIVGWRYSFMYQVWEKIPIVGHTEMVEKERGPKPQYVPGVERLSEVEGWSWSSTTEEWVATLIVGQRVGFTPPRSLPPGVTYDSVLAAVPIAEQYTICYESLIAQGLDPHEARKVANIMVDAVWNMVRPAISKARASAYAASFQPAAVAMQDKIEVIGVYGVLIILTAVAGALIGSILERLVFPEDDSFFLPARANTYLLGPENWAYSRHIGTSIEGVPYYSSCEGIGTEYTRHMRTRWSGGDDVIDFPGGFVEEGYRFPYFIKYTWDSWRVRYVGMLFSVGENKYALKRADYGNAARMPAGTTIPYGEWCADFHWYL